MKNLILTSFIFLSFISCNFNNGTIEKVEAKDTNIHPLENTWDIAVPNQAPPEGLTSLSAEQCGACHQDHYKEWKLSTHAHAWTDLQFQAEIKKESSPFMCINCHVPLQNQQEFIIEGIIDGDIYQPVKKKNPKFDKSLQQEGITCAACHVRNNTIIGPTGTDKAPHKTVKDTLHLSENLCITCHNAVAVITPSLACSFETGDEWKAGPFFGKKNCKSCHMEEMHRSIVPGYEPRLSHFHGFPGSGIPKFDTVETKGLNGLEIYPFVLPRSISITSPLEYSLKVKNEHAGHRLPTGDPERFFLIHFTVINSKGDTVHEKTERIGEHWEWHPLARKVTDNNLMPGEERTYDFSYKATKKEFLKVIVKVEKHRLSQKNAKYNKLGSAYPLFKTIFEKEYTVSIK